MGGARIELTAARDLRLRRGARSARQAYIQQAQALEASETAQRFHLTKW